jgi:Galactose oxidase, central domain/Kelch motif
VSEPADPPAPVPAEPQATAPPTPPPVADRPPESVAPPQQPPTHPPQPPTGGSEPRGDGGSQPPASVAATDGHAARVPPGAEDAAGAPSRHRRNPRVLLAVAGLALGLVVAAVLLIAGGGDEDESSPAGVTSAVAATKLPADLDWRPVADPRFRRQYEAATAVGKKLWVFGGIGVKSSSTTTKVYDPAADSWRTGPGLPLALHHFMAVTYEGEAVVMGGFVPGDELTSQQSDRVYALRDGAWEKLPPLNHPRAAGAAAVVGDQIVVVGGQADGKLVPETEVFDGERWTDVADIPTPREHLGAVSDGRYLYASGGGSSRRTRTCRCWSATTPPATAGRS